MSSPSSRLPLIQASSASLGGQTCATPASSPADLAEAARLEPALANRVGRAIADYDMIAAGDRVMVAMSGGKDSYTCLQLLERMRRRAPIDFELIAVNVDQGYPGFRQDVLEEWLERNGFRHHMVRDDVASVVAPHVEAGGHVCSLCARLRRGILYRVATEIGATKIALGHHADDLIETLLLNQFFVGEIKTMPAKLTSDDERHVVIRPLVYVPEDMVRSYASAMAYPIICCMCPACGDDTLKRKQMKDLLTTLEGAYPGVKKSLLRSLTRVNVAHMLDRRWIDGGTVS